MYFTDPTCCQRLEIEFNEDIDGKQVVGPFLRENDNGKYWINDQSLVIWYQNFDSSGWFWSVGPRNLFKNNGKILCPDDKETKWKYWNKYKWKSTYDIKLKCISHRGMWYVMNQNQHY